MDSSIGDFEGSNNILKKEREQLSISFIKAIFYNHYLTAKDFLNFALAISLPFSNLDILPTPLDKGSRISRHAFRTH